MDRAAALRLPSRFVVPPHVSAVILKRVVDFSLLRPSVCRSLEILIQVPGKGLFVGGVTLPLALAELGLIDEYEFVVHPRLAGHGPTLFAGLSRYVDLKLVGRLEFGSGAVAMRYEPRR